VTNITVVLAIGLAVVFVGGYAVRAALRHQRAAMRRRYLLSPWRGLSLLGWCRRRQKIAAASDCTSASLWVHGLL
jgi:hypothetical protein